MTPLAIDLCCGLGGWAIGLLELGYQVIGVDNVPQPKYPGTFILADVLTWRPPADRPVQLIVASPPCIAFSHAKRNPTQEEIAAGLELVQACFDLASDARAPLVLENVHGLQRYIGTAANHYGKFYLWGDGVPALLPQGPRWKDRYKMHHRSAALRAMIPVPLSLAVGRYHLAMVDHREKGEGPEVNP